MMQVHCMRTDQGMGFTVMVGVWGLMSSQRISILFLKLTYGIDVFLQLSLLFESKEYFQEITCRYHP